MRRSLAAVLPLALAGALACCGGWGSQLDDPEVQTWAAQLAQCRAEGRDAGSYAAYEACKARAKK